MLQIWQGLGGKRPQVLVEIERLLWQVILKIGHSDSGEGTLDMLKLAFRDIDSLLEGVDVRDINWFDSGM